MNIFVYGCSFSSLGSDEFPSWTQMLKPKLGANLVNHAISGNSSENVFRQWLQDAKEDNFKPGDLIIFQVSSLGRLFFTHQKDFPRTASQYIPSTNTDRFLDRNTNSWYYENKHHLEWYLMNRDDEIHFNMRQAYKHTLRSFAESHENIKVLILENGAYTGFYSLPILNPPKNFFEVPIDFYSINENEFGFEGNYFNWVDFTKIDTRVNHLSIPNLRSMADLIFEIYKEEKMLNSYDHCFQKNVFTKPIKNAQDYFEYVNQNLIFNVLPTLK
jgi:hypothetical protein